jgi:hypothetical protein
MMAASDEAERVESLDTEELEREVAATGRDPRGERAKGLALAARLRGDVALAAVPAPSPVLPARRSTTRTLVWLVAAAVGVGAVVFFVERQREIAHHERELRLIGPDPWVPPTPQERAEKLRDEAARACDGQLWGRCRDRLDQALQLDPSGETGERVQAMRKRIVDAMTRQPPTDSKGPERRDGLRAH